MEFVVSKENLLPELTLIQGVVERKTTMPILSNLLLKTGAEGIELLATDLEVGLKTRCEADVTAQGEVTVQARKLFDVVKSLPGGDIRFRLSGESDLGIECEQSRFKLRGLPASDFPALPQAKMVNPVNMPGAALKDLISKVLFAVTVDDPVYSLNGALMRIDGKTLTLVATDGHRLAYVSSELDIQPLDVPMERVVHRKTLTELSKMMADIDGGSVSLGEVDNHLLFRTTRSILFSRFLEKSFPAFEKVLPKENNLHIIADRLVLTDALKRVSLLSSERSRAVRLKVTKGNLEISSNSPELGEAVESLAVDYDGTEVIMGFNARYLLDFLDAVSDEKVRLSLKDADTQGLLTPAGDHPEEYRYVVMPMQLRGDEVD